MNGPVDDTRVLLSATVPPVVAYLLVRDHPDVLRRLEAKGRGLVQQSGVGGAAGRQVLASVAELRQASREWQARFVPGATSVSGNAEVPRESERAGSGVSSSQPGLTTREVADRLGLTRKQITNLVRGGRLVGHLVGRTWVIDEVSVAAELERRQAG